MAEIAKGPGGKVLTRSGVVKIRFDSESPVTSRKRCLFFHGHSRGYSNCQRMSFSPKINRSFFPRILLFFFIVCGCFLSKCFGLKLLVIRELFCLSISPEALGKQGAFSSHWTPSTGNTVVRFPHFPYEMPAPGLLYELDWIGRGIL